jgi:hypothetical protein
MDRRLDRRCFSVSKGANKSPLLFHPFERCIAGEFHWSGAFIHSRFYFLPGDWRRNRRLGFRAQGIDVHRRFVFVILTPINEHPPFAKPLHAGNNMLGMLPLHFLRERVGERLRLPVGPNGIERNVNLQTLRAGGFGEGLQAPAHRRRLAATARRGSKATWIHERIAREV